ncbi:MAG: peptidylprolyl isomerase [Polyangiales bacterium]
MTSLWIPRLLTTFTHLLLCACFVGGCGDDASEGDAGARDIGVVDTNVDAENEPGVFIVDFDTSAGSFAVEVHSEWSPNGAAHFRALVESGYYDDQRIFRVIPGFVAQWGIHGTPADHNTMTIPDDPVRQANVRGTLSFAKTPEPNSRASQVFISYVDNRFLDGMGFAPFGRVVEGLETVDSFNGEYEDTPVQARIVAEGNTYLDASFPNLTQIRSATIR